MDRAALCLVVGTLLFGVSLWTAWDRKSWATLFTAFISGALLDTAFQLAAR